jgi:hypothetical protein
MGERFGMSRSNKQHTPPLKKTTHTKQVRLEDFFFYFRGEEGKCRF